jgi:hypothetical protein
VKDSTAVVVVVVAASAAAGALLFAFRASPSGASGVASRGEAPSPENVGLFPDLRVGQAVLVDSAAANLPAPFSAQPLVPCVVDMILSDRSLVSVRTGVAGLASFSGTIPRSSIRQVLPTLPPGLDQV